MADDVIINKIQTIQKCMARINEECAAGVDLLKDEYTKQDAVVLNLERLAQASIDIASHIIRVKRLGVPQTTRECFMLLAENNILSKETCLNMQKMVGFRNIAVHDYQSLNIGIVINVVSHHLQDFDAFIKEVLSHY